MTECYVAYRTVAVDGHLIRQRRIDGDYADMLTWARGGRFPYIMLTTQEDGRLGDGGDILWPCDGDPEDWNPSDVAQSDLGDPDWI